MNTHLPQRRMPNWRTAIAAIALLASTLSVSVANAEDGHFIIGYVTDADSGDPLAFCTVQFFSLASPTDTLGTNAGGIFSNEDGRFQLFTKTSGWYRFLASQPTYKPGQEIAHVTADTTFIDFALDITGDVLAEVTVTATALKNTEGGLLTERKNSGNVSDGISAAEISRSGGSNAAKAVSRVTGVTSKKGHVYVRGLGERYSATEVNGAAVSSPEPNKRVLPLDIFSSNLISSIEIQKTYSPDKPGDFAGGVVDIQTIDIPAERTWKFGASVGRTGKSTGEAFSTYDGGDRDWIGFDDGTRDVPSLVRELAADQPVKERGPFSETGFTEDQMVDMAKSFKNEWVPTSGPADPSYSFSANFGDKTSFLGRPLGVVLQAGLSNSRYRMMEDVTNWQQPRFADDGSLEMTELFDYDVERFTHATLGSVLGNVGYDLGEQTKLRFRTLYTRMSEDEVREYEGFNSSQDLNFRNTRFQFIEQGVLATSGEARHPFFLNSDVLWRYSYSDAERNEPDRREYTYEEQVRQGGALIFWQARSQGSNFTRIFGETDDESRTFDAQWKIPFSFGRDRDGFFKTGLQSKRLERGTSYRRFKYDFHRSLRLLPVDSLITDAHIDEGMVTFSEATFPEDAFIGTHDVDATFVMAEVPITKHLRVNGGVRWEDSRQYIETGTPFASTESDVEPSEVNADDPLPAANVIYTFDDRTNVRFGYSRTVNRPDLRELSPIRFENYANGVAQRGNPELQRARIENYDFRIEHYPGYTQVLSASVFYKNMTNPIEMWIDGSEAGNLTETPQNADGGTLYGVELEARFGLGGISRRLRHLGVSTNLTFMESEADVSEFRGLQNSGKRPLAGQSPYVVNVGLNFDSRQGTRATLAYNVFGKRLDAVGVYSNSSDGATAPDIYERPFHSLDFKASLADGLVNMSFENLLDDEVEFRQGSFDTYRARKGRKASISFSLGR